MIPETVRNAVFTPLETAFLTVYPSCHRCTLPRVQPIERTASGRTSVSPRQAAALVRALNRRLAALGGMRAARAYALGIAFSFSCMMLLATGTLTHADAWLREVLVTASWAVGGLAAWALTRPLAQDDVRAGLDSVTYLRGLAQREVELARWAAGSLRIAAGIAVPALCAALVGALVASSEHGFGWFGLRGLAICGYALGVGFLIAAVARVAFLFAGRAAKVVLLLVFVGPELIRAVAIPQLATFGLLCSNVIRAITSAGSFA